MVTGSKNLYSEALCNLEQISDEIHQQREEAKLREEMGARSSGVGAETPQPPPYADSQDLGNIMMAHAEAERAAQSQQALESESQRVNVEDEFQLLPNMRRTASAEVPVVKEFETMKHPRPTSIGGNMPASQSIPEVTDNMVEEFKALPNTHVTKEQAGKNIVIIQESEPQDRGAVRDVKSTDASEGGETVSDSFNTMELLTPCSEGSVHGPVTSPDTENEADIENTRMNAEIMDTLQKAKNLKSPFLRPNRSRDDLFDEGGSDCESITGSMASMSVMDDEQIENLMMETGSYVSFLAKHAEAEPGRSTQTLPSRLSYLQDYVKFQPEWVDEENQATAGVQQQIEASKGERPDRAEQLPSSLKCEAAGQINKNQHVPSSEGAIMSTRVVEEKPRQINPVVVRRSSQQKQSAVQDDSQQVTIITKF